MESNLSINKTARLAASLFFFVPIPLYLWDQIYVSQVFVPLDPVTTATNLLSNEFAFRFSMVSHLAGNLAIVFMVMLFYSIFRPVDKHLSRLMLFPVLAQFTVIFVFEVFNYSALMVLKSDARSTFCCAQQQEAAYFLLRMTRSATGAGMGKLFMGLCFIPFGMLVLRSGFAPRFIGILLIIGGAGYVVDCCIALLLQRPVYVMVRSYLMYTTLCYFAALLWFLVKGVRNPPVVVNHPS